MGERVSKHLWGYVTYDAATLAVEQALTTSFGGHEVFYIVAPRTMSDRTSADLHASFYPEVPLRRELREDEGFFDCAKATRVLGWRHDD